MTTTWSTATSTSHPSTLTPLQPHQSSILPSHPLRSSATRTCNDENIPQHALNLNLELRKSAHIPDFLKAACTKTLLNHILFSRGITPAPVNQILNILDQMKQEVQLQRQEQQGNDHIRDSTIDCSRHTDMIAKPIIRRKRKRSEIVRERKYEKHGGQIKSILFALDTIFGCVSNVENDIESKTEERRVRSDSGVKAVLITLGPSFSSPREQYLIRFHKSSSGMKGCESDVASTGHTALPPPNVRHRLEQEIGRRSVREFISGTMKEEYSTMFEMRGGISNSGTGNAVSSGSSMKVNVACLLSEDAADKLFHSPSMSGRNGGENELQQLQPPRNMFVHQQSQTMNCSNTGFASCADRLFAINRRISLQEPRMYSKTRGVHRPFAVLNVIPALTRPVDLEVEKKCREDDEQTDTCSKRVRKSHVFEHCPEDVWVSLRSFVKAFRV